MRRAETWQTMGHGFEVDQPETFPAAGQSEKRCASVQRGEFVSIDEPDKSNPVGGRTCLGSRLESGAIVAIARDHQLGVRYRGDHVGPNLYQLVMSLVAFALGHSADHQHRSTLLDRNGGYVIGMFSTLRKAQRTYDHFANSRVCGLGAPGSDLGVRKPERGCSQQANVASAHGLPRLDAVEKHGIRHSTRRRNKALSASQTEVREEDPACEPEHLSYR